ncbi:MAG: hypothetical protein C0518_09930 [Opitutus sp.]|nr:hypothetical protein [Opitutus sp.]
MNFAFLRVGARALAAWWCSAFAFVGVIHAAPQEPFAGVDDKWRHYQSPNFELFSRVGDDDSRTLLREIEVLRALFLRTLDIEARAPAPVTIYYFGNVDDFRRYLEPGHRKNDSYRAFYLSHPDRGVMLLAPLDSDRSGNQLALSSYVYHLFRMAGERAPMWFTAGFAHLFETLEVQSERVNFGKASPGRVRLLQQKSLMPLESLMGIEQGDPLFADENASSLFYAQSWAVVHYWTLGQHKLPRAGIDRFLKLIRTQRGLTAAERRAKFEECFGLTLEAMNKAIDSYVASGRYTFSRVPLPDAAPKNSYVRRAVAREEIRERLGEVAYRAHGDQAGRFTLLDAIGRDRTNARAFEALGAVALREGDRDQFRDRWAAAIEAGTTNPAVIRQFAQFESERWFRQFDYYFRLPPERADYLRELLLRSIKVAPLQAEAYEQLAWVEASAPTPSIRNVNLVQSKFATLEDQPRTLLALALVRLRLGDRAAGEKFLAELEKGDADMMVRQAVETVRATLENRPPRRLERPETPTGRVVLTPGVRKP